MKDGVRKLSDLIKRIVNTLLPFIDFLYILQLEEYYPSRYFRRILRFYFRRNLQKRGVLNFTQRIKTTFSLAFIISLIPIGGLVLVSPKSKILIFLLAGIVLSILLIPISVGVANLLATPIYNKIRKSLQNKASNLIKEKGRDTKIIAVAGSYGKTSTKNFIYQFVRYNYRTQLTPGNINTPTGIAVWLNENFDPSSQLLIVEMDAYEIGEIAACCKITPPDIAVLTVIGDQHLERFGDEEKLKIALQEVFTYAKPNAYLITDRQTKAKLSKDLQERVETIEEGKLSYMGRQIEAKDISESKIKNLHYALKVAEILKIPFDYINDSIKHLEIPERRQKITKMMGYDGIDDTYNISFTTAQAGLKTACKEAAKRKKKLLVITAGIPELSKKNKDKNREYGRILEKSANKTIILGSIFAKEIASGFSEKSKYEILPNMKVVSERLQSNYPPDQWFLLLQPELTDLYY